MRLLLLVPSTLLAMLIFQITGRVYSLGYVTLSVVIILVSVLVQRRPYSLRFQLDKKVTRKKLVDKKMKHWQIRYIAGIVCWAIALWGITLSNERLGLDHHTIIWSDYGWEGILGIIGVIAGQLLLFLL